MADEDEAAEIRQFWSGLGLPGVIDVHTHFMPKSIMDKVWHYFDSAGPLVGREWPIIYRAAESQAAQGVLRKRRGLVHLSDGAGPAHPGQQQGFG